MTTNATRPDYDVSKMIARTQAADKAKGRLETIGEKHTGTLYWRMDASSKYKNNPPDIVRVHVTRVTKVRRLLDDVARYVARRNDHDPTSNYPLDLSFPGELKQTGTEKKTKIWHLEEGIELPPEQRRRPGKCDWPALLILDIDYPRATALLLDLANYFNANRTDPFEVTFSGRLVQSRD